MSKSLIETKLDKKPDFLALAAEKPGFFPSFLESQSVNEKIGKFDILFAAPSVELVAYDEEQLFHLLESVNRCFDQKNNQAAFQYGWFVYFSYEAAYFLDKKLKPLRPKTAEEPLAVAIYCQGSIVYDHFKREYNVYAENETVSKEINATLLKQHTLQAKDLQVKIINEESGDAFKQAVSYTKNLIQKGDVYQANLSRQYKITTSNHASAVEVYIQLKQANPAPFAGLLQVGQFAVISSSPERLFSISNQCIETRPIAGTRPRGHDINSDKELIKELINTPKERAEHIMLIDLERNDIGKVCKTGSVEVDELMVIETYEHVHHIVSNVRGVLAHGVTFIDVLKSLFPGGTITGCPKIRCMEVIKEIEQRNRGCYTGSMGYINHDGQVDLNILIRTIGLNQNTITFSAGAGIVYDSNPDAELQETRHKAKGMLNAMTESNTKPVDQNNR